MRTKIILIFISLVSLSATCFEKDKSAPDSTIYITNNTKDTLLYYYEYKTTIKDSFLLEYSYYQTEEARSLRRVLPFSKFEITGPFIKHLSENNYYLMLFLMNETVIVNHDWNTVRKDYLILKRYDLTLDSLEARNWTITYP